MGVMQRGALLAMASVDGIEGRAARFEAVFTAHSGVIYAYARRRVTKEEAEDVVSEAFLVAWRRLDDLPAEPVPWLIGVARAGPITAGPRSTRGCGERRPGPALPILAERSPPMAGCLVRWRHCRPVSVR